MLIGDLDLERAFRDPDYRRRVTAFVTEEPGAREPEDERPCWIEERANRVEESGD